MTNILITGATGFIGSHLIEHLSYNINNTIYGLSHSIKFESPFFALNLNNKSNVNLLIGDVTDSAGIEEILSKYDIDQIYHLAAQPIVKKASITPVATYKTNIFGTLSVLEAIRLIREVPTFVMSTDKAYGFSTRLPYTEDMPLNGNDMYSSSKACEDIIARSYAYNYDLPIVVVRPSNAYGFDFHWTRLIPSLAKACFEDKPLILNKGSYYHIREYTYVKDLVKAMELLLSNIDKTRGEAYNISSNYKYTTKGVVDKFLELCNCTDKKIEFKEKESTFKEIPEQFLGMGKFDDIIHWHPEYTLERGLLETIEKYKEWFNSTV